MKVPPGVYAAICLSHSRNSLGHNIFSFLFPSYCLAELEFAVASPHIHWTQHESDIIGLIQPSNSINKLLHAQV